MIHVFRGWAGSADALQSEGAVVACRLWPSRAAQEARRRRGRIVTPQTVHLLIDTGAAVSGVVGSTIHALELAARRRIPIVPVSQETFETDVYSAIVELGVEHASGSETIHLPLDIVGLPESVSGAYHGVLGRDFLRAFALVYEGPAGRFELRRETP